MIWDDAAHITPQNLRSWEGLWRTWFDLGATQQYYPVLHSAFWFEHRIWGDSTLGYHLMNVLLHSTAACLVAVILRRLTIPGAWFAAAIFALHPVHVESVAWMSEQKNTLSAVFYLSAALVYLHFEQKRRPALYVLGLGLFSLGLMSKSVIATLPAALLVVFWWQRGQLAWKRDVVPLIPWLIVGATAGLFTAWVESTYNGAAGDDFQFTLLQRNLLAGRIVVFYFSKLVWPVELTFIYPRWTIDSATAWQYLFPLGVIAVLAWAWLLRRRNRGPLAASLFFIGSLVPALGFLNVYPFIFSFVADHFQYLASLGIITLLAGGITAALARMPDTVRSAARAIPFVIVVILAVLTWRQSRMYRDAETVYQNTLSRNPNCWMAHNNLGNLLREEGRNEEAIPHFETALQLKPDSYRGHYNIAQALRDENRIPEAIAHYQKAIELDPKSIEARNNLAILFEKTGQLPQAVDTLTGALQLNAGVSGTHYNLGRVLEKLGRMPEAMTHYEQALKLKPEYTEARNNLGIVLGRSGRMDEAVAQFEAALRLDPNSASSHFNLALTLSALDRSQEAAPHFREARRLNPSLVPPR